MKVKRGESIITVLVRAGIAGGRSDARRLIMQGAVRLNDDLVVLCGMEINHTGVLRVGKNRIEPLVVEEPR